MTYLVGLILLLNSLFVLFRAPTIINPLSLFTVGWVFPFFVAISMQNYYGIYLDGEFKFAIFVLCVLMEALLLIPMLAINIKRLEYNRTHFWNEDLNRKEVESYYRVYLFFLFFSVASLVLAYMDIGSVPILDPGNYKIKRRLLRASYFYKGYSVTLIVIPLIVYVKVRYRFSGRGSNFLLLVWFFLSGLTGWSGNMIYPVVMCVAAYSLAQKDRGLERRVVVRAFMFSMLFFVCISFARSVFNLGMDASFSTLIDERTLGRMAIYFSYPFYNFQEVYYAISVKSWGANFFVFLSDVPFMGGFIRESYDSWNVIFISQLHGDNIYNRGANTLTYLAPLYFDFGFIGVLVFSVLICIFAVGSYVSSLKVVIPERVRLFRISIYISFAFVLVMLFTGLHMRMLSFYIWPVLVVFMHKLSRYGGDRP